MKPDKHKLSIEQLLQELPSLERNLSATHDPNKRRRIERLLNQRLKRLERLIPYKFRRELGNICAKAGIDGNFVE